MSSANHARSRSNDAIDAAALYRDHARFVGAFVQRLGAKAHEVDDLVQETFLVAHKQGGYVPGPATPKSWLGSIALKIAHTRRRSAARRRVREQAAGTTVAGRPEGDPEANLAQQAMLRRVQRGLEDMGPDRSAIFVLFELEGESCDAIASALQIPVGTVYSRLHAARRQFTEALKTMKLEEAAQ